MADRDAKSTVRVADVRIPRFWQLHVLIGMGLGQVLNMRSNAKAAKMAAKIGDDLAGSVVQRWQVSDERADAMIRLTETLRLLTWALLAVALVTFVVAVAALAR